MSFLTQARALLKDIKVEHSGVIRIPFLLTDAEIGKVLHEIVFSFQLQS